MTFSRFGLLIAGFASTIACSAPTGAAPSSAVPSAPPPVPMPAPKATFGSCSLDCSFDFSKLDALQVEVTQLYHYGPDDTDTFVGHLSPAGRTRFLEHGKALASAKLEPSYGCGACVDGVDNKVHIPNADGSVTKHSYDASLDDNRELPHALHAADLDFDKLREALRACTSNDYLVVQEGCTPRDQLKKRPYSRP